MYGIMTANCFATALALILILTHRPFDGLTLAYGFFAGMGIYNAVSWFALELTLSKGKGIKKTG